MATPPKLPQRPGAPAQPVPATDRGRHATDELADDCAALETEVEELKVKYEMYFLGVERNEPNRVRDDLKKKVLRLKERFTRNAGVRFRVQSLHARFISYERLWLRSAREREEGTYRRDLQKAKRHARGAPAPGAAGKAAGAAVKARPGPAAVAHHESEDVDLSDFSDLGDDVEPAPEPVFDDAPGPLPVSAVGSSRGAAARSAPPTVVSPLRPAATPAPAAVKPAGTPVPAARPPAPSRPSAAAAAPPRPAPPAAAAPAPGSRLGEPQMRELYDAYVAAKKRCNEDVSKLTFDAVSRSVAKQIPEIMQAHKAKAVEFKVVIRDGKARLTAVPKS